MSIKKVLLIIVSGVALEAAALWLSDHILHWGLDRIKWRSLFVWVFFGAGFFSACWLALWGRLINKFTKTKVAVSQSNVAHATPMTPTQPAQPSHVISSSQQQMADVPDDNIASVPQGPDPSQTVPMAPPPARPLSAPRMAPPAKMAVQTSAILTVNPSDQAASSSPNTAPSPTTPISTPSQKEQDISALSDIDSDLDMMAFKHVALEGKVIDLVYSSDDVAVLCKLLSDSHTWTVDISQPVENCTWTDETGTTQHICSTLLAQKDALIKMESEAQVIPTIVLMRGTIQNYAQVENYLLQNQITLVKYEIEDGSEGQTLHHLLKDNFSLFPEDEEDEHLEQIQDTEEVQETEELDSEQDQFIGQEVSPDDEESSE